jgi:hypothetical protein
VARLRAETQLNEYFNFRSNGKTKAAPPWFQGHPDALFIASNTTAATGRASLPKVTTDTPSVYWALFPPFRPRDPPTLQNSMT